MKILMISYYYPPLLDVGCKRSIAFSKYLKQHGWDPYVLSVKNPDKNYCQIGEEPPPPGVPVFYTLSLFNLSWFFGKINGLLSRLASAFLGRTWHRNYLHDLFAVPDLFIGWIPGAVLSGYMLLRRYDIDCIYISCTPFSSAMAGMILKKVTNKPLVIDFRDPLAINIPEYADYPSFRARLNRWIENKIIRSADVFVVNTEEVRRGYIAQYPEIAGKTITIHNGFDHALLPAEVPEKFDIFTIIYAGNMYFNIHRTTGFFEAVSMLKKRGEIRQNTFQFIYYGVDHPQIDTLAADLDIADLVRLHPQIPHQDMLMELKRSHVQLLRIIKPMISTKLFEGLALNIPFLATIPEGEVADLISHYSPSSKVVPENEPQAIADALLEMMNDFHAKAFQDNKVGDFLRHFSREEMTRKLEKAIMDATVVN